MLQNLRSRVRVVAVRFNACYVERFRHRLRTAIAALLVIGVASTQAQQVNQPGPVASRIREDAPAIDSDLLRAMRDSEIPPLFLDFAKSQRCIDARAHAPHTTWAGKPTFAIEVDDGLFAVLDIGPDGRVRLFHVDVSKGQIRKKSEASTAMPNRPVQADLLMDLMASMRWHRLARGELLVEFADVLVKKTQILAEGGHKLAYHGESRITRVPLDGGPIKPIDDKAVRVPTEKECRAELLRHRLGEESSLQPPAKDEVIGRMQAALENQWSMSLDWNKPACGFSLADGALRSLQATADEVRKGVAPRNIALKECKSLAEKLPSCPLTRDLVVQLEIAIADEDNDERTLERIMRGEFNLAPHADPSRFASLRNLAAWRRLCSIAKQGDKLEDYEHFIRVADASMQARDAAVLRIDEILFRNACQESTVDAFDKFLEHSPVALQRDEAVKFAEELERERIDLRIANGDAPNEIATGLLNRYRREVNNKGRPMRPERAHCGARLLAILSDHPQINETPVATEAQDLQDEFENRIDQKRFQDRYLKIQEQHNLVLEQHLFMLRDSASAMNRNLEGIGTQLRLINGQFDDLLDSR